MKLESSKKELHFTPNWNIRAVFNLLDNQRRGYITALNLKEFFNLLNYEPSEDELYAIVRRIERQSKDMIYFEDLIMALDPVKAQMLDQEIIERQLKQEERISFEGQ